MYEGKSILAIIPARGGSKGLTRKNVLPLAGRPLIAWTIEAALGSAYVDRVVVSTDDDEIAAAAAEAGADVPFRRSAELATDDAPMVDVVLDAIARLEADGQSYDLVMLLQATSPLRTDDDVDAALRLLSAKHAGGVVSVSEAEHHPWWSNTLPEDGNMRDFLRPGVADTPRQGLPPFFRLNGALYVATAGYLRDNHGFMGPETYAYHMPPERSVDVDSLVDFKLAEALLA